MPLGSGPTLSAAAAALSALLAFWAPPADDAGAAPPEDTDTEGADTDGEETDGDIAEFDDAEFEEEADPRERSVAAAFDLTPSARTDPYGPRPPGVPRLTLEQISRYGLQNPLVEAAEARVEAMDTYLKQAKFAWIPTIKASAALSPGAFIECDDVVLQQSNGQSFDFEYCRSGAGEDLDVQTIRDYFRQIDRAGFSLRLEAGTVIPLLTFGKLRNYRKLAEVGVAAANLQAQARRHETLMRVREAHAALLLARESIAILHEAWDVVEVEKDKLEKDLRKPDTERDPDDMIELRLGEVELARRMREARKIESLALAALWTIAGDAAPSGFDVAETRLGLGGVRGGLAPLDEYKDMSARNRPEAKLAAAGAEAARIDEKLARSNFYPDLGVVVRARYSYANRYEQPSQLYYTDRLNFSNFYVGLAMSWNLDFHHDAWALKRARALRREAEHNAEGARRLLALEVEQAYRDLQQSKQEVDFHGLAEDLQWKLVISQRQKQSIGTGKFKDLRRSLVGWAEARFAHAAAITQHNTALAKLSRAVGRDLTDPSSSGAQVAPGSESSEPNEESVSEGPKKSSGGPASEDSEAESPAAEPLN